MELERNFSFGVARQLLETPLSALGAGERARVLGGAAGSAAPVVDVSAAAAPLPGGQAAAEERAFMVSHGLYWLVCNLADTAPVFLAVDDAQWCDASSARFLGYLARRLDELPVLLAVAARSGEPAGEAAWAAQIRAVGAAWRRSALPVSVAARAVDNRRHSAVRTPTTKMAMPVVVPNAASAANDTAYLGLSPNSSCTPVSQFTVSFAAISAEDQHLLRDGDSHHVVVLFEEFGMIKNVSTAGGWQKHRACRTGYEVVAGVTRAVSAQAPVRGCRGGMAFVSRHR